MRSSKPTAVGGRRLRVGACLSLSGKYARFGTQVARALEAWQSLDGDADLVVEDDRSDPRTLETAIRRVAQRCDVLLGPYSTQLMRVAGRVAAESGWLLWNHGGSGDDVEAACPGHIVSVLTPTSRYSEPFLRLLSREREAATLWINQGKGSFGRQVTDGAEAIAVRLDIDSARIGPGEDLPSVGPSSSWDLFSADTFEDDVQTVKRAVDLPHPPRTVCCVAAGVREFSEAMENPDGIFGIGQWFPGRDCSPALGPTEPEFLTAYSDLAGVPPDYPAVQAAAGAVLATHCARQTGGVTRDLLWSAAIELDTQTLFGGFKISPIDGVQLKHETVLLSWTHERLAAA